MPCIPLMPLGSRPVPATKVYQPIWIKGVQDYRFQRECDDRYQPIRELAAQFNRPFSVLDIGANYGYFDFRLMEEFDCTCVMVDRKLNMPLIEEREEEAHRTAHDPHLPTKGCERQDTPRLYTANPFTKNPVFTTP